MKQDRILDTLEKVNERLNSIDQTLVKQEENLKEHMRRTELLEAKVSKQDSKLTNIVYLLIAGAGASSVYYWPIVKDLLRFIV